MSLSASRNEDVDKVRRSLVAWRELVVLLKKVLDWEQNFYPGVIAGVVTFKFLLWWYMDPTLVACFSLWLLFFLMADQILPFVIPKIFPADKWNQENEYQAFCEGLVDIKYNAKAFASAMMQLKSDRPRVYLAVTAIGLLVVAWLGSALGDKMALYFCVLIGALYPGAKKAGLIDAYCGIIFVKIQDLLFKKAN